MIARCLRWAAWGGLGRGLAWGVAWGVAGRQEQPRPSLGAPADRGLHCPPPPPAAPPARLPLSSHRLSHGDALPAARHEERRVGRLRADERREAQCSGVGLMPDTVVTRWYSSGNNSRGSYTCGWLTAAAYYARATYYR